MPALSADMPARIPTKGPAVFVAPVHNWTGFYVGAQAGYGWEKDAWTQYTAAGVLVSPQTSFNAKGALLGGQLGYNYQMGAVVLGVEGDLSWAGLKGTESNQPITNLCNPVFNCETKINWLATVTGRLGYAWGPALLYAKGGAAWAGANRRFITAATGADLASASETRTGWTLGGGFEYAFTSAWSAKLEYDYLGFGTKRLTFVNPAGPYFIDVNQNIQVVKVGLNYNLSGLLAR
jgi:outer membrane immunogenic protein